MSTISLGVIAASVRCPKRLSLSSRRYRPRQSKLATRLQNSAHTRLDLSFHPLAPALASAVHFVLPYLLFIASCHVLILRPALRSNQENGSQRIRHYLRMQRQELGGSRRSRHGQSSTRPERGEDTEHVYGRYKVLTHQQEALERTAATALEAKLIKNKRSRGIKVTNNTATRLFFSSITTIQIVFYSRLTFPCRLRRRPLRQNKRPPPPLPTSRPGPSRLEREPSAKSTACFVKEGPRRSDVTIVWKTVPACYRHHPSCTKTLPVCL